MSDKREFTDTPTPLPWVSVVDKPLFTTDERGRIVPTPESDGEFLAAIPCKKRGNNFWWIRHCVVTNYGLCIVDDGFEEPAGWELEDVEYYCPIVAPFKLAENER